MYNEKSCLRNKVQCVPFPIPENWETLYVQLYDRVAISPVLIALSSSSHSLLFLLKTSNRHTKHYFSWMFTPLTKIRGWVNNYPQCSCICVSVGSTVVFACTARRGFLLITTVQIWSCSVSSFVPTVTLTMAGPLSVCTKEEQRSVIRLLWSEGVIRGRNPSKTFSTIREQCFAATECLRMDRKIKKWSHKCYAWRRSRTPVHGHSWRQYWARTWRGSVRQTTDYWWSGKLSANYWQAEAWNSKQTPRTTV